MKETFDIDITDNFSFRATVYSHGWSELAPFELDEDNWRLKYVFSDGRQTIPGVIFEDGGKLRVELEREPGDAAKILADVRHLLRLDDDLNEFYRRSRPTSGWRGWLIIGRVAWCVRRRFGKTS